jgi:hypothetical protein
MLRVYGAAAGIFVGCRVGMRVVIGELIGAATPGAEAGAATTGAVAGAATAGGIAGTATIGAATGAAVGAAVGARIGAAGTGVDRPVSITLTKMLVRNSGIPLPRQR